MMFFIKKATGMREIRVRRKQKQFLQMIFFFIIIYLCDKIYSSSDAFELSSSDTQSPTETLNLYS